MTSVVSWEHIAGAQETALQSAGLICGMRVEAWEKEAILFDCKGCGSDCGYGRLGALEALHVRLPVCIERGGAARAGMSPSPAKHKRKGPMKRTDTSDSKLSDADFETWNAAVRDAAKEKADEEYAMRKAMHESGDTTKAIELVEKGTSGKVETEEWSKGQVSKKRPKKVDTPDRERCGIDLEATAMEI